MAAITTFINSLLNAAFDGGTYTGGVITMKLFTVGLPSATGVEVVGGGYAAQTLNFASASAKTISASTVTFTDLPTSTIVAYGVYSGATLIDEALLTPSSFTPDVTNNSLEINYSFNLNA